MSRSPVPVYELPRSRNPSTGPEHHLLGAARKKEWASVRRTCTQWPRWTVTLPTSTTTWDRSTIGISTATIPSSTKTGVGAGEVGGQALSLGLIDHVAIDIVPIVFGRAKPYFGTLAHGHLMLDDPEVVIQGDGVLHLRYQVHRGR